MTARKKKSEPVIEATAEVAEEPPVAPVEETAITKFQYHLMQIQESLLDRQNEDHKILRDIYGYLHPVPRPWYTSPGIWLAIILTLIMFYLLYAFYMSETGHTVRLPDWLNQPIILK